MNNFSLTALLGDEHRADLLRQAERYRRAHDAQARSRRPRGARVPPQIGAGSRLSPRISPRRIRGSARGAKSLFVTVCYSLLTF